MKLKKLLCILLVLIFLAVLAIGGLAAVKKAYSMYKHLFDEIKTIHSRVAGIEEQLSPAPKYYDFDYSWLDAAPPLIAHACGGIDGYTYTNSLEAFEYNYALGHRLFEIDFDLTQENILVASHEKKNWYEMTGMDSNTPMTYDLFESLPLLNQYHSLNAREIIALMQQYPDIYLVTDTKYTDRTSVQLQFAQLVRIAKEIDPAILDRIIPQIYHEEMLSWIMDIHPFRSVIFTLYMTSWTPESIMSFCAQTGVRFITMSHHVFKQEIADLWNLLGIHIGVHTVNDPQAAHSFIDQGVDAIYTDTLLPADFKN